MKGEPRRGDLSTSLCSVPDRAYDYPARLDAVENNIWRATNYQLADSRLCAASAEIRMIAENFDHRDNTRGQTGSSFGLILRDVSSNLLQSLTGKSRPDNFYRHSSSPSCVFPHAHLGGGSSCSVPHESSHAFMSFWLT